MVLAPARAKRRPALRIFALLAGVGAIYAVSGRIAARFEEHAVEGAKFSLLAVGDTGKRHRLVARLSEGQMAVANAMIHEDRRDPVDALVLLGDNFYMLGLQKFELVARLRENLVYPYCHFLRLDGPRSSEIESACRRGHAAGNPVSIHAVLGNHDFGSIESPGLQREVVPEFITNWSVPREYAVARELAPGVTLILFDSEVGYRTQREHDSMTAVLRSARGPWIIIASHSPMAIGEYGNPPEAADYSSSFEQFVRGAIEESGARVHLYLAGHHHSLQIIEGEEPPGPALHVVAGSGSRWREIQRSHPKRRFGLERLGFARVDLVGKGRGERLVVSVFKAATLPLTQWGGPSLRARWSIDVQGRTRDLMRRD